MKRSELKMHRTFSS